MRRGDRCDVHGFTIRHERIVFWKRLQERPFLQGDSAILRWMSEASIAEAVELGGNRWGRSDPIAFARIRSGTYVHFLLYGKPLARCYPSRAMFLQASSYVCGSRFLCDSPLDLCSGSEDAAAPASRPSKYWMVSLTVTNLASEVSGGHQVDIA